MRDILYELCGHERIRNRNVIVLFVSSFVRPGHPPLRELQQNMQSLRGKATLNSRRDSFNTALACPPPPPCTPTSAVAAAPSGSPGSSSNLGKAATDRVERKSGMSSNATPSATDRAGWY